MLRKTGVISVFLAGWTLTACVGAEDTSTTASAASTEARIWIEFGAGKKDDAKAAVQAARGRLHYELDHLGAIVASVPAAAVNGLRNNPNILDIEEDPVRTPLAAAPGEAPPYGIGMVESLAMHAAGITGAGVKVCIIDSGLRVVDGMPVSSEVTYVTGNLPANQDGSGHGTHVAGTVAGTPYTIGVAPGASLIIVRVFDDSGTWAYSSTLADAANKCVNHGADVINMSLGGGTKSRNEQKAFDNALAAGVLPIAAAGNGGNTQTSYPAGYGSVVSVAAIDSTKAHATFSQANKDVELAAPGVRVWSSVPFLDDARVTAGTDAFLGAHIENAAYSSGATGTLVDGGLCDSSSSTFSGKVVLCARGTISFYDKVVNAAAGGAIAVAISNNVSGGFFGTLGDGNSSSIPAISISLEDGDALRASKLGTSVAVKSTHDTSKNGYDAYDGTSMATPHVAGVTALVMSACPSASVTSVRNALTSTAEDLGAAGRDNQFGYGLVRACRAAQALCGVPASCP
jgi:serine protease